MNDERHTHERYRGGGRAAHDPRNWIEGGHRQQPTRRYARTSYGGWTDEPPGRDALESTERRGLADERRDPSGPVPEGDRHRWTADSADSGRQWDGTEERYRRRYGRPVGRWRFQSGERDPNRGSGASSDDGPGQPRDPETGRFLPKDETNREGERRRDGSRW